MKNKNKNKNAKKIQLKENIYIIELLKNIYKEIEVALSIWTMKELDSPKLF